MRQVDNSYRHFTENSMSFDRLRMTTCLRRNDRLEKSEVQNGK